MNAALVLLYLEPWIDYQRGKVFFALGLLLAVPVAVWVSGRAARRIPGRRDFGHS